jgi:K+-transporting ATPase ATPase C chain
MITMPSTISTAARRYAAALRTLLVFTVILGVVYPLTVTAIGQLAFSRTADGSIVTADGRAVGSSLIGQSFTDADGAPLPEWFQPRPSAAGDGYDPTSTSASNLGPNNEDLLAAVVERRAAASALDGTPESEVTADALTASGSGLDPHISPEYAYQQVDRVAKARQLPADEVRAIVDDQVQGRILGILGEERVNVLELNLALDQRD